MTPAVLADNVDRLRQAAIGKTVAMVEHVHGTTSVEITFTDETTVLIVAEVVALSRTVAERTAHQSD